MERAATRRLGWLAGLVAWGLLACAHAGPGASPTGRHGEPGPLLWLAEAPRGDGAFFLLGSVHLGDPRMLDLGETVRAAYDASDELVVEVDLSQVEPTEMAELVVRYARLTPPATVQDVLSEETWLALARYLDSRGLAREAFLPLEPWFVSVSIVQLELGRAGYQPELGVDHLFIDASLDRKPIVALETAASQLQVLDSLSPQVQDLMLNDTLSRVDELAGETEQMIQAWQEGDEQALHELVFGAVEELPELDAFYERVYFERNRTMVAQLAELAQDGRTRFVVLGAGHMLGEEGIPALLGRRGYRVQAVRR